MAPAITWEAIEDAIQAWVSESTGVPGNRCIWTYQGGAVPGYPYIELSIDGVRGVGHAWKVRDDAPDAVDGAELRVRARQHQVARLQLQYFADQAGTEDQTGREPIEKLSDALAAIDLYEYELDEAGIGIGEVEAVQYAQGTKSKLLMPRAVAGVQLHLASEVEKRETYLRRFQLRVSAQNSVGTELGEVTFWQPQVRSFSPGFSRGFEVL